MVFWKKNNKNPEQNNAGGPELNSNLNKDGEQDKTENGNISKQEIYNTTHINPDEAGSHFNKSIELYDAGKYDEAIAEINKAISINPENSDYYDFKGSIQDDAGRSNEALVEYDRAISINPENSDYYYNKSLAHANLMKYEEAITDVDRAISINPNNAHYYSNRATYLFYIDKDNESIREFDKAISLNPEEPEYHNIKGIVLDSIGKYKEAIVEFDISIGMHNSIPVNNSETTRCIGPEQRKIAELYLNKAKSLERMGNIKSAIELYGQGWVEDPFRLDAQIKRCELYFYLGQYKEAEETMGPVFTYDIEEIEEMCEIGNCVTSDLIRCLEIVIKSCQEINKTDYLDTYVKTLLELDPENQLAQLLNKK